MVTPEHDRSCSTSTTSDPARPRRIPRHFIDWAAAFERVERRWSAKRTPDLYLDDHDSIAASVADNASHWSERGTTQWCSDFLLHCAGWPWPSAPRDLDDIIEHLVYAREELIRHDEEYRRRTDSGGSYSPDYRPVFACIASGCAHFGVREELYVPHLQRISRPVIVRYIERVTSRLRQLRAADRALLARTEANAAGSALAETSAATAKARDDGDATSAPSRTDEHGVVIDVDREAATAVVAGVTIDLRSTARARLLEILGKQSPHWTKGILVQRECHVSDASQLVVELRRKLPTIGRLIESSRDGYRLSQGTVVRPCRPAA